MREIKNPSEIKKLSIKELEALAGELREEIVTTVADRGGHLASNLGVVELTLALHYVFNMPSDKLIFDVGHQAYAHKLLTGRMDAFKNLRTQDGLSGFPQLSESDYDVFTAGHASTAISAALGMAHTRRIMNDDYNVIAVVGDGALTGGMCYEALNDAGQSNTPIIVILNDNDMSISRNVGALSKYLTGLRQTKTYRGFKRGIRRTISKIPGIGLPIFHAIEKMRDVLKDLLLDGRFFSALGFEYIGPIDGHDLRQLIRVLSRVKNTEKPVLVHTVTKKGYGYAPAESNPTDFHGVAPFYVESGESRKQKSSTSCGYIACRELSEIANSNIRICGITAAMAQGTGMEIFAEKHADRFFDVGIAEEHAILMAGGMAATGLKPYIAMYSSFLQRGYDQMLIDICRNDLPVTFLIDRAGFVGEDGATHQGLFDLSFLRTMPNMIIAVPRDVRELKKLVHLSTKVDSPMAIRYPKMLEDLGAGIETVKPIEIGQWELLSDGTDAMMFAMGRSVQYCMQAAIELMGKQISAGVVDARFVKPMDTELLTKLAKKVRLIVTVEENVLNGGFGEGVTRFVENAGLSCHILNLGVDDVFVHHGTSAQQLENTGLNSYGIANSILKKIREIS